MEILGIIATLLLLAATILSYIWLVVIAFNRSMWWGLAVLLIPIAEIIFVIKYWRESRIPFLTNAISGTAFLALLVYMSVSTGRFETLRTVLEVELGESRSQEIVQFLENITGMENPGMVNEREKEESHEMQDLSIGTLLPQIDEKKLQIQTSAPQQVPTGYKPIAVTEATNYIGESMKVVGKDGIEHEGTLKTVSPDRLLFQRWAHGGRFAFELKTADIKSLQVYR